MMCGPIIGEHEYEVYVRVERYGSELTLKRQFKSFADLFGFSRDVWKEHAGARIKFVVQIAPGVELPDSVKGGE